MKVKLLGFVLVLLVSVSAGFHEIDRQAYNSDEGMWIRAGQNAWAIVLSGDDDFSAWQEVADFTWYVNPPIAKYVLGIALSLQGIQWSWQLQEPPPPVLAAARKPSAILGVLGCVGLLWIGLYTLTVRAAIFAALALAMSPLWVSASRMAMTDVYGAGLSILSVGAFVPVLGELAAGRRWRVLLPWIAASGALSGLAVGAKLNAAVTPIALGMVLLVTFFRELWKPPRGRARDAILVVALASLFVVTAVVVFVGPNPYLHEDAWNRFSGVVAFWQEMCIARATRAAADGVGAAFFPERNGVPILLGKLVFPPRAGGLLLAIPLIASMVSRWTWARSSPESSRLLGWLLLIPATLFVAESRNQIVHAWIPWVGLLGAFMPLVTSTRDRRSLLGRTGPGLLIPVWAMVVTFLIWKNTYVPHARYYLPLLPLTCLAAGYGLASLRNDLSCGKHRWPRRLVDVAILAGVLSVLTAVPDQDQMVMKRIATEATLVPGFFHWLAVASLTVGIVGGLGASICRATKSSSSRPGSFPRFRTPNDL